MKSMFRLVGAAAAFLLSGTADAALLSFNITGPYTASWTLDSNPTPNFVDGGYRFNIYDVEGSFSGASTPLADLIFYSDRFEGGLAIEAFYADGRALLVTTGPQIYGGTEDAPTFAAGNFALADFYNSSSYTLTISGVSTPAVPEPATWAMMVLGLGIAGATLRRRSQPAIA